MTYLILIHSDGKPHLVEVPNKPELCETDCDPSGKDICDCAKQIKNYNETLSTALSDTEKFIPIKNEEDVFFMIAKVYGGWEENKNYEIPNGYSLKFERQQLCKAGTNEFCDCADDCLKTFAILIKSEEPKDVPVKEKEYPHREICGLCHLVSPVGFWVPNEIWESVVHHSHLHSIHCLSCFIERADEKLIDWSKEIKFYPISLRSHIEELKIL